MFEFDWKVYAALVFVLILMALPVLHRKLYGQVPEIHANELFRPDKNYRLIDLRPADAFQISHIEHAVNMPCSQMDQCKQQAFDLIASNDFDSPVVLVCDTDLLSTKLSKQLIDMGCENVFILKGGFNFWKRKRLPLIKG